MSIVTVFMIAVGLAMDAFAVSVASGCLDKQLNVRNAMRIALFFGGFQAAMPIVGWLAGSGLKGYVADIDHWVAFVLLGIVGGKMIFESFKLKEDKKRVDMASIHMLLVLSIATSIDALIVGFSLSFLQVAIITPAVIIGIVTFVFSLSGVYLGKRFGHIFESKIELMGGLILIGIGIKILIEHTLLGG